MLMACLHYLLRVGSRHARIEHSNREPTLFLFLMPLTFRSKSILETSMDSWKLLPATVIPRRWF